jgi:uncharacterized protein (TIGR03118 family)
MNKTQLSKTFPGLVNGLLLIIFFIAFSIGCRKANINNKDLRDFQQVNLVSDNAAFAPSLVDPTLLNAWGLAWAPSGIAWVNSMSGHVSELYTGDGAIVRPPINIPSPAGIAGGLPTGIVFAGGAGFTLANKQPALFIFDGVDGILSAWNGADGSNAQRIAPNAPGASYTGLALATWSGSHFLYAANFGAGSIDVWDTTFSPVKMGFRDPALPGGYAPFNIQSVGSWLFVMYAKVGANGRDQAGAGLGFVDVFNTDGSFVKRFASRGNLNAPWGVVMTPANFLEDQDMGDNDGKSGNDSHGGPGNNGRGDQGDQPLILIGNFGDGHIGVYSLDGIYAGQLQTHNRTIVIDGLWALSFAPSTSTIDPKRLYFTAGPNGETDGLFGYLIKE